MQNTPNFNFMIAEGTDTVNLLTQCYPNFTSLDSILQGIKETGVTTATATKTGTNFAVVRTDTDCNFFRFVATANYVAGDTFTVDGVPVTATSAAGTALPSGAFVINQSVIAILNSAVLTVLVGGGLSSVDAVDVDYDNTVSGLTATDVQAAIDEVQGEIAALPPIPTSFDADDVIYDNTVSGLTATDVQAAIDELATMVAPEYSSAGLITGTGVTITSGGYYVLNGYCHVDVTINSSSNQTSGANVIEQLPPASSGTGYITPQMNNLAVHYNSGAGQSTLSVYANFGAGSRRFIGSYPTTVTP